MPSPEPPSPSSPELSSQSSPASAPLDQALVLEHWRAFQAGLPIEPPYSRMILDSWRRSHEAGVDPSPPVLQPRRVPAAELEARLQANTGLLAAARPHLTRLSQFMLARAHAVYLVDRDGIVLAVAGNDPVMIEQYGLAPGFDRSERAMGTNGAGTALAVRQPVAVVGPEHFVRLCHACACTAAPVWGPDGLLLGAIDVVSSVGDWLPERTLVVAYAADAIGRDLDRAVGPLQSPGVGASGGSWPPHVLVVDDSPEARYAKVRLLASHGCRVTEAATGEEAIARAIGSRPHVVCLDLKLPDVHGMEVMRRLKADPRTASTMVLQISASYPDLEHKIAGLEEGADGFLAVPYEPAELVATVKALHRSWAANRALQESEERFRSIFEHGPLGMALVSSDHRFLKVNGALCRITGYAPEELCAKTFVEITHPEDVAADTKLAAELYSQAIPSYAIEKRYIKKSGESVWVRLTAAIVRDDCRRPLYAVALIEDISGQKAQSEKLEEQATLLNLAHAMIRRPDGEIIVWTDKFEELYGWRRHEAVGEVSHVLLKTEFPRPLSEIDTELQARGEWSGELIHTTRQGRRLVIASHWVLHRHGSGRAVVLEVDTDITLLKQTMDALRESEARLAAILQSTSAVVYLLDTDSRFVLVNRSFEKLLGTTTQEAAGRSVYDFFAPNIADAFVANNRRVLTAGQPMTFEEVAALDDGIHIYTSMKAPVYDGQGRTVGIVGVSTDITERKGAEQKIRRLLEEAEQREEALREKQAQLVQAANLASLGELATGLAHELNNPLNNIALFVGNALDRLEREMQGRAAQGPLVVALRSAEHQINRAAHIIRQLRAFARTGSSTRTRARVALLPVVQAAVAFHSETIGREGVTVEVELLPPEIAVWGAEHQLQQVFVHLLANALDAVAETSERRIRVVSRVHGSDAVLSVRDDGIGIPPEVLPRIFDPFFTTKPPGRGAGLGLSTAYGIVKDHDGDIQVESEPGRGTVFSVRLPLYEPFGDPPDSS